MPPFRQPTPSPPPPQVAMPPASSAATATMPSSATTPGGEGKRASAVDGSAEFVVPANFVPPPPPREVGAGVSNLGNTCYMNAALQALAHAPELCHALDAESHVRRCPVALRNERRRRGRAREAASEAAAARAEGEGKGSAEASAPSSPVKGKGKGKGGYHRRTGSGSSAGSGGSSAKPAKRRKGKKDDSSRLVDYGPDYEYCTLCELERLMGRVHSRPEEVPDDPDDDPARAAGGDGPGGSSSGSSAASPSPQEGPSGGPVVPETFVSGFMSEVAPWFRRGVQEDSHEFLRLLIDAMQNSCKGARSKAGGGSKGDKGAAQTSSDSIGNCGEDTEYPFRLFRGTVESNVKCSACRASSCKIDPIEDIGLDVLPLRSAVPGPPPSRMSSSRSASPAPAVALADVQQALERFISSERLDSGYKCEKCGRPGKATKTSRLASIPPILTLHLKRFRYGSGGGRRGGGGGGDGGGGTRSSRSARGSGPSSDFDHVGPSGSAKVEGHVRFSAVLDVKPYLTPELQRTVFPKAICRLFAVVVHSGKNSHSGHYVAYVHNVTKKEWWRMDDARIARVPWNEVQNAEAYMLFYRVTSHPVARGLKEAADAREEGARWVAAEVRRRGEARAAEALAAAGAERAAREGAARAAEAAAAKSREPSPAPPGPSADAGETGSPPAGAPSLGKRARPALSSGKEWMRDATTLTPDFLPVFSRIEEYAADTVKFTPEYEAHIAEEHDRMSSQPSIGRRVKDNKRAKTLLGKGPGGVHPPEDVVGGAQGLREGILDLMHQISIVNKANNGEGGGGGGSFLLPAGEGGDGVDAGVPAAASATGATTEAAPAPIVDELIIPPDNAESYDGAL